jgi:predicted ATPase
MAFPQARLYEICPDGMEQKELEALEHFTITKAFLNDPARYLAFEVKCFKATCP